LQALFSNLKQSKSMIYKIFSLLLLSCFFSTSNLFFSEVKTENKAENKTEVAKTKKTRLKVMLRSSTTI
jgi:hypothetical protein